MNFPFDDGSYLLNTIPISLFFLDDIVYRGSFIFAEIIYAYTKIFIIRARDINSRFTKRDYAGVIINNPAAYDFTPCLLVVAARYRKLFSKFFEGVLISMESMNLISPRCLTVMTTVFSAFFKLSILPEKTC